MAASALDSPAHARATLPLRAFFGRSRRQAAKAWKGGDGRVNIPNQSTDLNGHYSALIVTPTNSVQIRLYTQDAAGAQVIVGPPGQPTFRWVFSSNLMPMNGDVQDQPDLPRARQGRTGQSQSHDE